MSRNFCSMIGSTLLSGNRQPAAIVGLHATSEHRAFLRHGSMTNRDRRYNVWIELLAPAELRGRPGSRRTPRSRQGVSITGCEPDFDDRVGALDPLTCSGQKEG